MALGLRMILKEKQFGEARDWKQAAGDAAEKEMAFFLRRYFGDDPEVYVLNDVRLEMHGDAAQMDHVLIHPAGLTIVESKSVSGKLQMKADGEWLRWYDNRSSGMVSPIIQAKMQAEFLRKFLRSLAKQPQVIDALEIDIMIAISSKGQFIPPKGEVVAEVCKADLVGERIRKKLAGVAAFPAPHRKILGEYMAKMHKPLVAVPAHVEMAKSQSSGTAYAPGARMADKLVMVAEPVSSYQAHAKPLPHLAFIGDKLSGQGLVQGRLGAGSYRKVYVTYCKACQSQNLEFRYGKFGYYFKCVACGENTGIKLDCRHCGRQPRLRKQDQYLYVECESCQLSEVLHRNDKPYPELAES